MSDKYGSSASSEREPRRGFLAVGAVVGGLLTVLTPLMSAFAVVLHPIWRRVQPGNGPRFWRVTSLDSLPADGAPRQFAVTADQRDAWTYAQNQRIGAVYLRREAGSEQVRAFNVVCPHAGCFVGYKADENNFHCPCHNSAFAIDGAVLAPSPSPRGLDELEVKVEKDGSVWVAFQNFYAGRPEKVVRT